MAETYNLDTSEDDLPEPVFALSPAPGGDDDGHEPPPNDLEHDRGGFVPPAGIRWVILPPNDIVPPPPEEPAEAPRHRRDVAQDAEGIHQLQVLTRLGLLHDLPKLQPGQLPLDLYQDMLCLIPPGEEDSNLFHYMFTSRLPLRLRVFCMGLYNHTNEALAEVADYFWRFWATEDPADNPVHYHRVPRAAGFGLPADRPYRRPRRNRRPRRASTPPPLGYCYLPGECGCWSCQTR